MAETRLVDANALGIDAEKSFHDWPVIRGDIDRMINRQPTIDPESLRPIGRWDWKHRHKGGFRKYTGVDAFGETHTITVDERFECDEPYCPKCGKWNESTYLNYCPNCGAKMEG